MSGGGVGIFSVQAVLISLVLHVVVVGALYSFGTSGEKPPADDAAAAKSEVSEPAKPPVEKNEAEPSQAPNPKPEAPEIGKTGPKIEKPKAKMEGKPAQIRIEPRADDTLESDKPVKKVETPEKKDAPATSKPKAGSGKTKVYVIKRGDTLTALAKECGLTVQELAALNGKSVKKLSILWVGQKIKLPAAE